MIKINKKNCTVCGACLNICPKNAITMKENERGFIYPSINEEKCINCSLCEKVCEKISSLSKNLPSKTLALQSKDFNISQKSSSGGMFAQIAKYVLSKNGVVFGCAMEKVDGIFEIKHIYIEQENDLHKLQGSKYVQSNIKNTYREAKQFLVQNRLVLFSGTPCQIAGLKTFLDKDYENLLCIDLSCTGVPSQKLFNDYVNFLEEKYRHKIINFEFRNKEKIGWECGKALITFENNKQKIVYNNLSSYLNLFINGGIHRESCYNCKFVGLNRVSDITIADCWGIDIEYPELLKSKKRALSLDKDKGISLVLINTAKGDHILNEIKDKLIIENIDINKLKNYNGPLQSPIKLNNINSQYLSVYEKFGYSSLDRLFKKNLGWKYYYYIIKKVLPQWSISILQWITKLLTIKKVNKFDCAIMCCYYWANYGSILTSYALRNAIQNLGYSAAYINIDNSQKYGIDFNLKYGIFTHKCINYKSLKKLNSYVNTFILGSDYQLNFKHGEYTIYRNLFNFVNKNKKKLIIAGSFGSEKLEASTEDIEKIKQHIKCFDYISVREKSGADICKEVLDCNADWTVDPIFLLDKSEYIKLAKNKKRYSNKIMKYILYPNRKNDEICAYLSKKFKKTFVEFFGNEKAYQKKYYKNMSVENWLGAIINCEFVITDSFHCVCFALMFNKPFICLYNLKGFTRFESLFEMFELNISNIYKDIKEIQYKENPFVVINYEKINQIIKSKRNFLLEKLEVILKEPKKITEAQTLAEKNVLEITQNNINNLDKWYKKNEIFYLLIIKPFIAPWVKIIKSYINND